MLENAQAVETAYAAYAKAIHLQTNEKLPMNSDKLQEAHQTCMSAAFEKFKEMAYDEGDEKKKSRQQLSARIEREFSSINEKNKAASFQQAEQVRKNHQPSWLTFLTSCLVHKTASSNSCWSHQRGPSQS
jgi:uncharacterized protein YicC (UPF0701 family)